MDLDDLAMLMRRSVAGQQFLRAATDGAQMTATSRTGTVYTVQFAGDAICYPMPFADEAVDATFYMYRATTRYTNAQGEDREVVGFAGIDPGTGAMLLYYADRVTHKRTSTVSITIP